MKIACVTTYDLNDRSTWPRGWIGICSCTYRAAKTFEALSLGVEYVGPLSHHYSLLSRAKFRLWKRGLHKRHYIEVDRSAVRSYARQIAKKLAASKADAVWCHENAVPIAYLRSQVPIVLWTDATLASMIDWYPYFAELCGESVREIYAVEKAALQNCSLIVYPSQWAAQSAIDTYGIDSSKIKVVPYGPNMESGKTRSEVEAIVDSRPAAPCRLLFIGTDWIRKGGNVAAQVAASLNESGLEAELTVVGCSPSALEPLQSFLKIAGYLDTSKPKDAEELRNLIARSHFLLLPTTADCFPSVLTEANSFGVPALATKVGGLETQIHDGLNGMTFRLDAPVSQYCDFITALMADRERYRALALSSFDQQHTRLNWSVSCAEVSQLITELIC